MQNSIKTATSMKKHKHVQNCNSVQAINADFQIPRENTCKVQPHALQISQLSEILGTSYKKIRSQRRVHDKTRHKLKSGRQTTDRRRRQPDNSTNPSRPYTAVCVRACVRACVHASKQGKTISRVGEGWRLFLPPSLRFYIFTRTPCFSRVVVLRSSCLLCVRPTCSAIGC